MKPVKFTVLTKEVEIVYTEKDVQLSAIRKQEIEKFWKEVNQDSAFHRGEVFHVDSMIEEEHKYKIMLKWTDYAHYLHTIRNHIRDEERCRIVFGAALVETKDGKFVFGEMANHTAHPGRLQCVGGGLSFEDKKGKHFDMKQSVQRELQEELAVDPDKHIEKMKPVYLKSGGIYGAFVILYDVKLKITQKELMNIYNDFTDELSRKGEKPEFQTVIFIENNRKAIDHFFENDTRRWEDYVEPLLKRMARKP